MSAKRSPKKKAAERPSTKRIASRRGSSVAKAMVSALPDVIGNTTLDREFNYYLEHLPEWYDHEGEHVLIHGEEQGGFFSTEKAALEEGYRRFGWVPFLVKQVQQDEKPRPIG